MYVVNVASLCFKSRPGVAYEDALGKCKGARAVPVCSVAARVMSGGTLVETSWLERDIVQCGCPDASVRRTSRR
jgi:hypothetical protein